MTVPAEAMLERAKAWAAGDERVAAAIVYGSIAHGTANDWSDLDLLVVTVPDQRAQVWAERGSTCAEILGGQITFDNEKPWNRPYLYHAQRADLVGIDFSVDEGRADPWVGLAEGHVVLVDKADVGRRLEADLGEWKRPEFDAPTFEAGWPNTWNWFGWLAGFLRKGELWMVRYGVMETLHNRVIPLLGSAAYRVERELSAEDRARLHAAAPRSNEPRELARALVAVAELYEHALDRWSQRTGRPRPRHPLAPALMRRLYDLRDHPDWDR